MTLSVDHPTAHLEGRLNITGSKSESNRMLVLQALYDSLQVENISNADDVQVMQRALGSENRLKDIHHAGTTMRFLTAYYATRPGSEVILTGSQRMQERPIGILVDALSQLGADIQYTQQTGYPPLEIRGKKITESHVVLPASISSQYISALMLVAPSLKNGLKITLQGTLTSVPYIKMTQALLDRIGVQTTFKGHQIKIDPLQYSPAAQTLVVESDWSSASYFYSLVALSDTAKITLTSYREDSLQGDAVLQSLYQALGVKTSFTTAGMTLEKTANFKLPEKVGFDLIHAPDLAQTIAVSCAGLGVGCDLTGLHTLKIKETDRLVALEQELSKLGVQITVTQDSLHIKPQAVLKSKIAIATYQDHRMALAFAPLGLKVPICIEEAAVVSKSYPDYWTDLEQLGFQIKEI